MKSLRFFFLSIGVLTLICPAVSSSQTTYAINPSAPYSYLSGTNPITGWIGDVDPPPSDDGYVDLGLGDFNFKFYGVSVNTLRISTNGYITFGAEGQEYYNTPIPYFYTPNALIAPFWTDLDLSTGGQVRWGIFGTAPSRSLVVEWLAVPSYDFGGAYSFEVIFYESTHQIKFQYLNVVAGTPYDNGSYATVGVENFDGTFGSEFSYNTASITNGLAILFTPQMKLDVLDFDGDGKSDFAIYRTSDGGWYIIPSTQPGAPYGVGWGGLPSDKPVPGDYDGDGKTDIAIYRESGGVWYIIPSIPPGTPYGVGWGGLPSDKPVPADYDGDGKIDFAIYRASDGGWYIIPSTQPGAPYGVGWGGLPSDKPVPADYDGDGKTDFAIYRASGGEWYVIPSTQPGVPYGVGWGGDPTDRPVPGDYDGDGKTDVAIYRSGNGGWYIIPSTQPGAPYGIGWGGDPTDRPVPGDYDGDGKTDVTVYRGSSGFWFVIPSSTSASYAVNWGGSPGDVPLGINIIEP